MKILEQHEYTILEHFLPVLVNGEPDPEDDQLNTLAVRFERAQNHRCEAMGAHSWTLSYDIDPETGAGPYFGRCELVELQGQVVDVTVNFLGETV